MPERRRPALRAAGALAALAGLGASTLVAVSWPAAATPPAPAAAPGSYAANVLADHPVGYWRLGEQAGTTLADASGSGDTGALTPGGMLGAPGALTGDTDTALDGGFGASAAPLPGGTHPRTLELWFTTTNSPVSIGYGRDGTEDAFDVSIDADANTVTVSDGDALGSDEFDSPTGFHDGAWHLLDVSYDGSALTVYLDGHPIGQQPFAGLTTAVTGQSLAVTGRQGIDEVAVYPSALDPAHITARWARGSMNAAACPTTPASPYPLVALGDTPSAYYRLGELSSNFSARVAFDSSGRCADGTLSPQAAPIAGALLGDADTAITGSFVAGATGLPSGAAGRTVEAWFSTTNQQVVVSYGRGSTSDGFVVSADPNANSITVSDGDSLGADRFTPSVPFGDGGWHLLDVTLAAGTATAYVDGRSAGSATLNGLTTVVAGQPLVASGPQGIDEVAIYPSALSAGDVGLHYLRGSDSAKAVVQGTITAAGQSVPGALIQLCGSGGSCTQIETGPTGGYRFPVGYGSFTLTVFPPPTGTGSSTTLANASATTSAQAPYAQVDVALQTASLPAGSSLSSPTFGTVTSGIPTVYWQEPTVYKTTGCPHGFGYVTITATDTSTGRPTGRFVPLVESPTGSGNYRATIPPLAPLHGSSQVSGRIFCGSRMQFFPRGGPEAGGTTVFVRLGGSTVTGVHFGSASADVTKVTADLYRVTSPSGSGDVAFKVDRADGSSKVLGTFHYLSATISGGNEGPADGGGTVHITGHGFDQNTQVLFGSRPSLSVHVTSSTQLTALAPPGHGTSPVSVYSGGAIDSAGTYDYDGTEAAKAVLEYELKLADLDYTLMDLMTFADEGNPAGIAVSIASYLLGQYLGEQIPEEDRIYLDIFTVGAETLGLIFGFEVTLPIIIGSIAIVAFFLLIDPSGTVVDADGLPVRRARVTLLRKVGDRFVPVPDGDQTIDPTTNPIITGSAGTFAWSAAAGRYEVRASSPSCRNTDGSLRTVTTPPFTLPPEVTGLVLTLPCHLGTVRSATVSGVSPAIVSTLGGNTVTVAGSGFTDVSAVQVGGVDATSFTVLSPTAISAVVPAGTGVADVTVTSAGTTSALVPGDRVTYVDPAPAASEPNVGVGAINHPVTFTGTGLSTVDGITSPTAGVRFGSVHVVSDSEVTALVSVEPDGRSRPGHRDPEHVRVAGRLLVLPARDVRTLARRRPATGRRDGRRGPGHFLAARTPAGRWPAVRRRPTRAELPHPVQLGHGRGRDGAGGRHGRSRYVRPDLPRSGRRPQRRRRAGTGQLTATTRGLGTVRSVGSSARSRARRRSRAVPVR